MHLSRRKLISLCCQGIVKKDKQLSRQTLVQLGQAWAFLKSGYNYTYHIENELIWVKMDWNVFYIPTQELLDRMNGEDWSKSRHVS